MADALDALAGPHRVAPLPIQQHDPLASLAGPVHAKPKSTAPHDPTFISRIIGGLQWAAESPVGKGLDAVLNAPERAVSGTLLGGVGRGYQNVAHPATATSTTHDIEQRVGLPTLGEHDNVPWYRRLGQGVEDFAVESALDPITYIPGLDLVNLARRGAKATGLARVAAAVAKNKKVDEALTQVVEFHRERKDVTRAGEDAIKSLEAAGSTKRGYTEQAYAQLVEQHRPALEAIDARSGEIKARLGEIKDAAKVGYQPARDEQKALKAELAGLNNQVPPEIRTALLQRAFVEGSPEVRRKARAAGYKPTPEEEAQPPLNVLHKFRDEYQPTQEVYDKDELANIDPSPIHYVTQGNRKAKFDLSGKGKPDSPLADRVLDRLIKGARIEEYHRTRRAIVQELGLQPLAPIQPALDALHKAEAAGDAKGVARLTRVVMARNAAHAQAEAARAAHLKPDVATRPRTIEYLAPKTAAQRALRQVKHEGAPGTLDTGVSKSGEQVGFLRQLERAGTDIAPIAARGSAQARALTDLQRILAGSKQTVVKTEAAATGQALSAEQAADRLADVLKKRAGGVADATGKTLADLSARAEKTRGQVYGRAAKALPGEAYRMGTGDEGEAQMFLTDIGRKRRGIIAPATLQANATKKAAADVAKRTKGLAENIPDLKPRFNIKKIVAPSERSANFAASMEAKHARAAERTLKSLTTAKDRAAAMAETTKRAKEMEQGWNTAEIPINIDERLFGKRPEYNNSLFKQFSDLQRDALFILPFAHMKNIAVLAFLGPGGMRTVQRGWRYAHELRVNPKGLESRVRGIEANGGTHHYIRENQARWQGIPVVGKPLEALAEKSNKALERYDLGMRLALEDELKRKGITGFQAGGQIRDVLGDYNNQAPLIRELRARFGANFPGWRLGIVPRSLTKALRESPRATHAYARSQRLASDDVTAPMFGTEFDAGGPAEDFSNMVNPYSFWTRFLKSPSTLGWPSTAIGLANALPQGKAIPYLGEQVQRIAPGGSIAGALTGFPFQSNAPALARGAAGVAGAYFPNRPTADQRKRQLRSLHMPEPEVFAQMQREGYYPKVAPLPVRSADPLDSLAGPHR